MGYKAFSSRSPAPPRTNSGERGLAAGSGGGGGGMDRWTGVLNVPRSRGGPPFRVAASLVLTPAKTLAVSPNPLHRRLLPRWPSLSLSL